MSKSPHILIVDDDPTLTEAASWYLEAQGLRATRVANGAEALEVFCSERPDAVIIDIMMPGMNGFDLCRAIRATSKAPVMMLSAREGEADKVRALDIGADDYVTKLFGAMELVARVKALLRRARETGSGREIARSRHEKRAGSCDRKSCGIGSSRHMVVLSPPRLCEGRAAGNLARRRAPGPADRSRRPR